MAWNFKSLFKVLLKKAFNSTPTVWAKWKNCQVGFPSPDFAGGHGHHCSGQESCKNLSLGRYPCEPILLHRYASKEEQTNYNHSIPSNRVLLSFKLRKLLSASFERIKAQCSPASTVWAMHEHRDSDPGTLRVSEVLRQVKPFSPLRLESKTREAMPA